MSKSPIKTIIRGGKLTVKGGTAAEKAEARDSWDSAIGDYKGERNRTAQARTVTKRQSPRVDDIAKLAAALRRKFTKQEIAERCRELRRR